MRAAVLRLHCYKDRRSFPLRLGNSWFETGNCIRCRVVIGPCALSHSHYTASSGTSEFHNPEIGNLTTKTVVTATSDLEMKRKQQAMLVAAQPHPFDILLPEKTLQLIARRSGAVPLSHLPKFDSDRKRTPADASLHASSDWKPITHDGRLLNGGCRHRERRTVAVTQGFARGCQVPMNNPQKHQTSASQCPLRERSGTIH
jgi:hypothetical protein